MTNSSNTYRRVRALCAKTVAANATVHESVSAFSLASKIITDHDLDPRRIEWPTPPTGYRWEGVPGRGGTVVEMPVEKPKGKRAQKAEAKAAPKPKAKAAPTPKRVPAGERLAKMAARPEGFTVWEVMEAFGIQQHSARAMISTELRKVRGLDVRLDKETRRYSVAA